MKKLRIKVFITIFIILTISVLGFISVYNVEKYVEKKRAVENSLMFSISEKPKNDENIPREEPKEIKNIRFMDSIIYTVVLDEDDNITEVINHSNNDISEEQIKVIAKKILKKMGNKYKSIGNLYFSKYSYIYKKDRALIIMDNSLIIQSLSKTITNSILLLIVLEVIIILISKVITKWITKPAEDAYEKQKTFITDVSHELKTPLSVIMASSEALADNPKEVKWLNNINTETARMNLLITDLLELARTEKKDLVLEKSSLSKAVELSVLTFEGRAYEKGIKLKYDIEEDIKIKMNENSIRQVVEILLDNAIKHSKEKEVVNISLKQEGNSIKLTVKNKGGGIPKGEEEKIFERFYRVDKSRNRNENRYGLGLSIAKNIIESHSGKIYASSNKGITTFTVILKK